MAVNVELILARRVIRTKVLEDRDQEVETEDVIILEAEIIEKEEGRPAEHLVQDLTIDLLLPRK